MEDLRSGRQERAAFGRRDEVVRLPVRFPRWATADDDDEVRRGERSQAVRCRHREGHDAGRCRWAGIVGNASVAMTRPSLNLE